MDQRLVRSIGAVAMLLLSGAAEAGDVEVTGFGGVQNAAGYGGPHFGAAAGAPVGPEWRFELVYSRQPTSDPRPDAGAGSLAAVERYLAALQQETGVAEDRTRFFGSVLVGASRFITVGRGSEVDLTVGLGLGLRYAFSERFGLRAEARGFYVGAESTAAGACEDGCVFEHEGAGNWEGDLTAGLTLRF